MMTQLTIERDVRALGVRQGDVVVVHSALRSIGWVEGAEDAVIDGLASAVGSTGTLCMPTLTFGHYGPRRPPPPFDPRTTPSVVGRIPERFRQRPGVIRSLHPTHSIAGAGARAVDLLRDHHRSPTPCGPGSPWGRIARAGSKVLMLGVGTSACTMFHGPEEEAEPDARCTPPTPCRLVTEDGEIMCYLRLHRTYRGAVSNRSGMYAVLRAHGLLREGRVGRATALLIDAQGLWNLSLELLRAAPSARVDYVHALGRSLAERVLRYRA